MSCTQDRKASLHMTIVWGERNTHTSQSLKSIWRVNKRSLQEILNSIETAVMLAFNLFSQSARKDYKTLKVKKSNPFTLSYSRFSTVIQYLMDDHTACLLQFVAWNPYQRSDRNFAMDFQKKRNRKKICTAGIQICVLTKVLVDEERLLSIRRNFYATGNATCYSESRRRRHSMLSYYQGNLLALDKLAQHWSSFKENSKRKTQKINS